MTVLRVQPQSVMRFLEEHFDVLGQLYRIQLTENLISGDAFQEITRHLGSTVVGRFQEYRIIREAGESYRITEEVSGFMGFLTQEFRPLLPGQLRRYHTSISEIYGQLASDPKQTDEQRIVRLEHLHGEILDFLDSVTNNTNTLLKRTQSLKVNRSQLTYAQRLREARMLIGEYIEPLNSIVDLRNGNSIAHLLAEMGKAINLDRLELRPVRVTERYEQLDQLLRQVNRRLQRETEVIYRELTPLLERIRRESEVMNGWLAFLEQPLRHATPAVGHRHRLSTFGNQTGPDLRMYFEQFAHREEAIAIELSEETELMHQPLVDTAHYRRCLQAALPLDDFFDWTTKLLESVPPHHRETYFLGIAGLLFDHDAKYVLCFRNERRTVTVGQTRYVVPSISVSLPQTLQIPADVHGSLSA